MQNFRISTITVIYSLNIEFFMLVNQILLYSVSNNTNNIRFKLCKNGFIAVNAEKKRLKGAHSPLRASNRTEIFMIWT